MLQMASQVLRLMRERLRHVSMMMMMMVSQLQQSNSSVTEIGRALWEITGSPMMNAQQHTHLWIQSRFVDLKRSSISQGSSSTSSSSRRKLLQSTGGTTVLTAQFYTGDQADVAGIASDVADTAGSNTMTVSTLFCSHFLTPPVF